MSISLTVSHNGQLRSITVFRVTQLKPSVPYSADSHGITIDASIKTAIRWIAILVSYNSIRVIHILVSVSSSCTGHCSKGSDHHDAANKRHDITSFPNPSSSLSTPLKWPCHWRSVKVAEVMVAELTVRAGVNLVELFVQILNAVKWSWVISKKRNS